MCVRMRPIYSAKLKLLGPLALLSKPSISAIHFFNHLSFICDRLIKKWTPEDCQRVQTDMCILHLSSTDGHKKGAKEEIATQATQTSTQTPTSTIFGDDETIAKVLLNMSQAKAVSREKEKGVELKDIEEVDRPKPTSTRSLLTLKPLPKIDPKDKGKKKIEEEDESESESDGIPEAEKKFKQLENDEEMARKMQEE
ncbi:hypothetical protein Tco_0353093 [Tanacetum coccineum]